MGPISLMKINSLWNMEQLKKETQFLMMKRKVKTTRQKLVFLFHMVVCIWGNRFLYALRNFSSSYVLRVQNKGPTNNK